MNQNSHRDLPNKRVPPKQKTKLQRKNALKRGILVLFAALAALGLLCAVLAGLRYALTSSRPNDERSDPKTPTLEGKHYINFYEPDYETDIFTDPDYLAKNRTLRYVIPHEGGNTSLVLDEYPNEALTEGQRFFVSYFKALTLGDTEAYHSFFADTYDAGGTTGFEKHPKDRVFPMQRVYDITITELGRTNPADESYLYNGKPAVFGVYEVRYKILKNDGELRYDLPENGENPLIFELVTTDAGTENELTLIKAQYKYTDIAANQS